MSQRKYYFLPPLLNINELNTVLTGTSGTDKLTDNACLLYTVLCQDLVRLRLTGNPDGYTQVHSRTLETIFDNNYAKVMGLLRRADLLEVFQVDPLTGEYYETGYYSKTEKVARAYRIPAWLRSPDKLFRCAPIATKRDSKTVIFNKLGRLNNVTSDPTKLADNYRQLIISNMKKLVLLDNAQTRAIIAAIATKKGIEYDDALGDSVITKFNESPLGEPTICHFAGRIHGKALTIVKALRAELRYAQYLDSALVEIDLVASQPWFLSIVSPALIKKFVPECAAAIPFFKEAASKHDVILFKKFCSDATPSAGIYDELARLWNEAYQDTFTRDQAKAICYRAFFSDYERKEKSSIPERERKLCYWTKRAAKAQQKADVARLVGNLDKVVHAKVKKVHEQLKLAQSKLFTQKCYELFRAKFPGMWKLFRQIKTLQWDFERGQKPSEKKIKYYANNALLAQRLEANIVFGVVVKALVDAKITRLHTIHDAFVVRVQDEAKARKVIKRAFKSIGLSPNFK